MAQHIGVPVGGDSLHFRRDGRVFAGQIRVIRSGIHDAQGVTAAGKIEIHPGNRRAKGIGKVDGGNAAYGAGHLIHQPAGFAEKHIFGVLADLGNLNRRQAATAEKVIENDADENLVGGGRGQARALQHVRNRIGIETAGGKSQLAYAGGDAAD